MAVRRTAFGSPVNGSGEGSLCAAGCDVLLIQVRLLLCRLRRFRIQTDREQGATAFEDAPPHSTIAQSRTAEMQPMARRARNA
jgi:hypothetical protein